MLRSFHYAAYAALFRESGRDAAVGGARRGVGEALAGVGLGRVPAGLPGEPSPRPRSCRRTTTSSPACSTLHLLEKAVYELGYELDNRPDWVVIPARGLEELLDA